jgi:hypothetical protein
MYNLNSKKKWSEVLFSFYLYVYILMLWIFILINRVLYIFFSWSFDLTILIFKWLFLFNCNLNILYINSIIDDTYKDQKENKFVMTINQAFLAHLIEGNVSFFRHLASVVCRPLTFHILVFSSETTYSQMNWNLVESIYEDPL